MSKPVIIVGCGGHALVVADILRASGGTLAGFLDDRDPSEFPNMNVIGKTADIPRYSDTHCFLPGIGNNATRQKMMNQYDVDWVSAVHPSAVIAPDVQFGNGTVVMANAVINPGSRIGKGVIINTAATVDHDCILEDFVHISPGAHLAGTVSIGSRTWVGIGGIISNNISLCADVVIGAGAVVVRNIDKAGTYVGVPAKFLKCNCLDAKKTDGDNEQ